MSWHFGIVQGLSVDLLRCLGTGEKGRATDHGVSGELEALDDAKGFRVDDVPVSYAAWMNDSGISRRRPPST